jgi:hypothetical protein
MNEIQICCGCREAAAANAPILQWMKKNVPDEMVTSSPCLLDGFSDLSDEALLKIVNQARGKPDTVEEIYRRYAILKWGSIEIEKRGLARHPLWMREQDDSTND